MNWVSPWGIGPCLGLFLSISTAGEQSLLVAQAPTVVVTNANFIACKEPRPEICYEVYAPVCAVRKVQVQCTLAPCLNTAVSYTHLDVYKRQGINPTGEGANS